jgi:hypothetical protein
MNRSSSRRVAVGMRAIAGISLVALFAACGGTGTCSSVSGKTYAFAESVTDGGCHVDADAGTTTFQADGTTPAGWTWSQVGCDITVTSPSQPTSKTTEHLVVDGSKLEGSGDVDLGGVPGCTLAISAVEVSR